MSVRGKDHLGIGVAAGIGMPKMSWADRKAKLKELKSYFKALAGLVRLRIIIQLAAAEELSVSGLAKALKISQPLVSWHLPRLKKVGLVKVRKEGRQTYCSLDKERFQQYQRLFTELLGET
ncbi:MAG: ArsR/SmtB family transcription factor [Anaerolineae bacterium]